MPRITSMLRDTSLRKFSKSNRCVSTKTYICHHVVVEESEVLLEIIKCASLCACNSGHLLVDSEQYESVLQIQVSDCLVNWLLSLPAPVIPCKLFHAFLHVQRTCSHSQWVAQVHLLLDKVDLSLYTDRYVVYLPITEQYCCDKLVQTEQPQRVCNSPSELCHSWYYASYHSKDYRLNKAGSTMWDLKRNSLVDFAATTSCDRLAQLYLVTVKQWLQWFKGHTA